VHLPGLTAGGYEWTVEITDGDPKPVAVEQIDPETASGPPGASLDHVFRLSALLPGEASVRFEQRRQWEPGVPAHDVRTFRVVVEA
jgi:hypothetical protein